MKKIFIAGHNGMVGSHIHALLKKSKNKLIIADKKKLNLLDQAKVINFLKDKKPDQVYICAAVVGGIMANSLMPAKFIYENLLISINLIHGCLLNNIKKILYLGSSCIYPKLSKIPIKENYLLGGFLEKTNEAYAISKIAGLSMCKFYNEQYKKKKIDYRAVMPCNLYGPRDNYDPNLGHVIPSLIYKFHKAKIHKDKKVILWGDGSPKREFLYVKDMAEACVYLMNVSKNKFYRLKNKNTEHVNIGSGNEISIYNLSKLISKIIGYKGKIIFDKSKPNGTARKLLDSSRLKKMGWKAKIQLKEGIENSYQYFLSKNENR
jgi:GDP-L-fucose synthase